MKKGNNIGNNVWQVEKNKLWNIKVGQWIYALWWLLRKLICHNHEIHYKAKNIDYVIICWIVTLTNSLTNSLILLRIVCINNMENRIATDLTFYIHLSA